VSTVSAVNAVDYKRWLLTSQVFSSKAAATNGGRAKK